ncbi:hypothetical protein QFZ55_008062 [Streptomyces luteogriseus]|uniref:hypothetical protein n=1 Tax=Streptomyces luteogriseus TaxID=68233 RepID=UPI00277F9997|nr:hypothetical protein [Streptomyces luteogriseus]MDQ0718610.1 hypothetical protein [Streptomyces luteogriseus]
MPDRDVTVLAASDRLVAAPPADSHTPFTGGLIEVLRSGVADGSETLSLSELYGELRRRLAAEGSPLPTLTTHNDTGQVALTRNRAR